MFETQKRRVYELVNVTKDPETGEEPHFDWFDRALAVLIVLNVAAVVLETERGLWERYHPYFRVFDLFSTVVFTIEYVMRIWSCTVEPRYAHPVWGRLKCALHPLLLFDLLAILPAYLPGTLDLRTLRAMRLLRILRVLKLGRYSDSVAMLWRVLKNRRGELLVMLFVLGVVLIMAASVVYYAEHETQPDKFSSIPASKWWAVITLTTIGYGDVYPVTGLGRLLGGFIAIIGIGIVALPAGILASGFSEEIQQRRARKMARRKKERRCPHCGRAIEEEAAGHARDAS